MVMEVGREAVDDAAVNHGACQPCGANGMTVVSPRVSELVVAGDSTE